MAALMDERRCVVGARTETETVAVVLHEVIQELKDVQGLARLWG